MSYFCFVSVVGLNQNLLGASLPTPLSIVEFFLSTSIGLRLPSGEKIRYQVLGTVSPTEVGYPGVHVDPQIQTYLEKTETSFHL